jgi:L-ascorbate metabolism protein UlaG (beta-lactamase superfamily)
MVKTTWLGHAGFKIETEKYTFLIDPWIDGNPVSPFKTYKEVEKADFVFVTHDHFDHGFDDAVKICKKTKAIFIGVYELAELAGKRGCDFIGGNIGGEVQKDNVRIYFAQAIHSSNIAVPCGFIVNMPEITIYHNRDTAFCSDMEYLSRLYDIDLMMVPICSNYMMGIREAVWAVEKS